MKPHVFIASSKEGEQIAKAVQANLDPVAYCTTWRQNPIALGSSFLQSFLESAAKNEFGVFVLTPDDQVVIRGETKVIARDNVILEAGVFLGRYGPGRSFLVAPKDRPDLHLPSDVFGLTLAQYDHEWACQDGACQAAVGKACTQIEDAIKGSDVTSRGLGFAVRHRKDLPGAMFPSKIWIEITNRTRADVVLQARYFKYHEEGFRSPKAIPIGDRSDGSYTFKFRRPHENVHKYDRYLLTAGETVDTYVGADPRLQDEVVEYAIENEQVGILHLTGLWIDEVGGTVRLHRKRI